MSPRVTGSAKASLRREHADQTRRALMRAARGLFARHGYAAVATEEVVARARVTRGALYHHFADKRALFRAVCEEVSQELAQRIAGEASGGRDPFAVALRGADAFLDACLEPAVQRILLIDAPAVLGWEQWRELDARTGLGLVEAALSAAMDAGQLKRQPARPLAHVLVGALEEAGLVVARASDRRAARRDVGRSVRFLIEGMRQAPAS